MRFVPLTLQRGFTLIELLVVISIIALLVAILMPSLSAARQSAEQLRCLSSQRQVGLGMLSYVMANKEMFIPVNYSSGLGWASPHAKESGDGYVWSWAWGLRQEGFITDNRLYICDTRQRQLDATSAQNTMDLVNTPEVITRYRFVSYGYNRNYIGSSYAVDITPTPARSTQLKKPTETFVLADAFRYTVTPPTIPGTKSTAYQWHMNGTGTNLLWADGHATSEREVNDTLFWSTISNTDARRHFRRD